MGVKGGTAVLEPSEELTISPGDYLIRSTPIPKVYEVWTAWW